MVGAYSLAPVLVEFLDVHCNGQSLQFLGSQVEAPTAVIAAAHCVGVVVVRAMHCLAALDVLHGRGGLGLVGWRRRLFLALTE